MGERILLIGTERRAATLRRRFDVVHAESGRRSRALAVQRFAVVVLDAASMYITGERLCRDMKARFPQSRLLVISGAERPKRLPEADLVLDASASSRRLNGAVSQLLRADPADLIRCGPFALNRRTRILVAHGRSTLLNPKLAGLIEFLLTRPNRTLPRAAIMQAVWKTEYLGDTRTLNVHVWRARQLLEADPQNPVYLKTVRGNGYRLETPTQKEPATGGES